MRLTGVEQALAGKKADAVAEAVKSAASDVADVNGDLHASAEYRQAMIPVFVRTGGGEGAWGGLEVLGS